MKFGISLCISVPHTESSIPFASAASHEDLGIVNAPLPHITDAENVMILRNESIALISHVVETVVEIWDPGSSSNHANCRS
ncbi:hypothetical protein BD410DRAFT_215192 [Rickenella mellea]|uniref:Uncharacterized protein n=1 Tax=Rickenella mellea TaxID=50990 RepID=A0A4Y7QMM7_9AGAM|nr:hypothetical protein BD410DRAFT_215192 [Rickenella mellea]